MVKQCKSFSSKMLNKKETITKYIKVVSKCRFTDVLHQVRKNRIQRNLVAASAATSFWKVSPFGPLETDL